MYDDTRSTSVIVTPATDPPFRLFQIGDKWEVCWLAAASFYKVLVLEHILNILLFLATSSFLSTRVLKREEKDPTVSLRKQNNDLLFLSSTL